KRDNLIPGGRIHNFRHFMDFPENVFRSKSQRRKPFVHPLLTDERVTDVVMKKDVMLNFPYHSFNSVIDLLREASIDPDVTDMKVHAKICSIKKRMNDRSTHFGFVATGNLNEKTAMVYADHCLLTSNQKIMADVNRMFNYLEQPTKEHFLKACKMIIPSPNI